MAKSLTTRLKLFASAAAIGITASTALAQHSALIIGNNIPTNNADTRHLNRDIEALSSAFGQSNYDVTQIVDGTLEQLQNRLLSFTAQSTNSESRVVYFSGGIVSVSGTNYLLPSDARTSVRNILGLSFNALALNDIIAQFGTDDVPTLIVVDGNYAHNVDDSLVDSGLNGASEQVDLAGLPSNIWLISSTAPSQRNVRRSHRDNDFNSVLAGALTGQGLSVDDFISAVQSETIAQSRNRQRPQVFEGAEAFNLGGDPLPSYTPTELRIWEIAQSNDTVSGYESFLNLFPDSIFAVDAKARINALTPRETIQPINQNYLAIRRSNVRAGAGTNFQRVGTLEQNDVVFVQGKVVDERWFKITMPSGETAYVFETLLTPYQGSHLQVWTDVNRADTIAAYRDYISRFPNGANTDIAESRITTLQAEATAARLAPYRIVPEAGRLVLTRNANIRDLPDTNGNRLGTLAAGTIVTKLGRSQVANWFQIEHQGQQSFVWGALVTDYDNSVFAAWENAQNQNSIAGYTNFLNNWSDSPFEQQAIDTIQGLMAALPRDIPNSSAQVRPGLYRVLDDVIVNVRPRTRAAAIGSLNQGENIEVISITDNEQWVQVKASFGTGWMPTQSIVDGPVGTFNEPSRPSIAPTDNITLGSDNSGRLYVLDGGRQIEVLSNNGQGQSLKLSQGSRSNDSTANGNWTVLDAANYSNGSYRILWRNNETNQYAEWLLDDDYTLVPPANDLTAGQVASIYGLNVVGRHPTGLVRNVRALPLPQVSQVRPLDKKVVATKAVSVYSDADRRVSIGTVDIASTLQVTGVSQDNSTYRIALSNGDGYIQASDVIDYQGSSKQAYEQAVAQNSISALQAFLQQNPNSFYRNDAIQKLEQLRSGQSYRFNLGGIDFTFTPQ